MKTRLLLLKILAVAMLAAPLRADSLAEARDRVANGEIEAAVPLFEKHLQTVAPSAEAYFELGKSFESLGREAEAALAFRRTLMLDPGFQPAMEALKAASTQLGLAGPRSDWRSAVAERIPIDGFMTGGAVVFWIGAFLFAAGLLFGGKRAFAIGSIAVAVFGIALVALAWMVDPRVRDARDAMVLAAEGAVLYRTPSDGESEKITTLGQGTVLKILSARGRWFHGELPGGQRGWFLQKGTVMVVPPV